jgi:hypothetical protein
VRTVVPTPAGPRPTTSNPIDQQGPPILPDPRMTPGAVLDVTKSDVCVAGYTKLVRNVPGAVKRQVYAEYGITQHQPGEYEVDHLISLELGGSNSIKNLWPESYQTQPWNAHVKDQLENKLHDMICSGEIDMPTAQQEIATDWIAAYKKYFHTDRPLSTYHGRGTPHPLTGGAGPVPARPRTVASAGPASGGQVWVNTRSGKYFRPGSEYYGKTKQGAYMTEQQAQAQGYVAAREQ